MNWPLLTQSGHSLDLGINNIVWMPSLTRLARNKWAWMNVPLTKWERFTQFAAMADPFLNNTASVEEVLETLSLHGVAVVDRHIADISAAREEFFFLMSEEARSSSFLQVKKSRVARIYNSLPVRWDSLRETLYSDYIRSIAAGF